jgi:hypothetical protein
LDSPRNNIGKRVKVGPTVQQWNWPHRFFFLSAEIKERGTFMKRTERLAFVVAVFPIGLGLAVSPPVSAQAKKPNLAVIMGDDIGIWNIGASTEA